MRSACYEDLYRDSERTGNITHREGCRDSKIMAEDVRSALKRLKSRRTSAEDGLVAEMLQTGHSGLVKTIAHFFFDMFQGVLHPPDEWKLPKLLIIFKQ